MAVKPEHTAMMPYQYVVLRCVPRADREEFVNVGVVLYCQAAEFLDLAWEVDRGRLRAFAPDLDVDSVCHGLAFAQRVCAGDLEVGEVAQADLGTRFGFLKAPRSTVVRPGPVHGGTTTDPAATLAGLVTRQVR